MMTAGAHSGIPQRRDEGEREDRHQRQLDGDDRHLGRHQSRRPRGVPRGGASDRRDPHRHAKRAVDDARDATERGRDEQHATPDGGPRGSHADRPRFGARQQRDELEQHRERHQGDRRGPQRSAELCATTGQHVAQHSGDRDRSAEADRYLAAHRGPTRAALGCVVGAGVWRVHDLQGAAFAVGVSGNAASGRAGMAPLVLRSAIRAISEAASLVARVSLSPCGPPLGQPASPPPPVARRR